MGNHACCERWRRQQYIHPLVDSHYFNKYFIRLDVMHVMECTGVTSVCLGSALCQLITEPRLGANQQERLERINELKSQYYVRKGRGVHRMPRILLRNLRQDGWGCLQGPAVKAANTKCLVGFVLELAILYFDSGTILHKSMLKVLQAIVFVASSSPYLVVPQIFVLTICEEVGIVSSFSICSRGVVRRWLPQESQTPKQNNTKSGCHVGFTPCWITFN